MAKKKWHLKIGIDKAQEILHDIVSESISSSLEEEDSFHVDDTKIIFQVYERYSVFGGNRLSLSVMIIGKEDSDRSIVTAITSGGSQAIFFKINRFGENSFLNSISRKLDPFLEN